MKRSEIAITIALIFSILFSSFTGFAAQCDNIRGQVIRLHILANSDSDIDQNLKLAVRDAVLAGTADLFQKYDSKQQVKDLAVQKLPEIQQIAQNVIHNLGLDYPVTARLTNHYFNTRVYDGFTLPAGKYDAVQLDIGSAAGKNWWCVMFPPMCLPAAGVESSGQLEDEIRQLGSSSAYTPAFAILEVVESLKDKLAPAQEVLGE